VYYSDVGVQIDSDYAEQVGFTTRMLRLADMDNGAIRAAQVIQRRARRDRHEHRVIARMDPQIELGDIGSISETLTGDQTVFSESFIVKSMNLQFRNGELQMTLVGRDSTL